MGGLLLLGISIGFNACLFGASFFFGVVDFSLGNVAVYWLLGGIVSVASSTLSELIIGYNRVPNPIPTLAQVLFFPWVLVVFNLFDLIDFFRNRE